MKQFFVMSLNYLMHYLPAYRMQDFVKKSWIRIKGFISNARFCKKKAELELTLHSKKNYTTLCPPLSIPTFSVARNANRESGSQILPAFSGRHKWIYPLTFKIYCTYTDSKNHLILILATALLILYQFDNFLQQSYTVIKLQQNVDDWLLHPGYASAWHALRCSSQPSWGRSPVAQTAPACVKVNRRHFEHLI